jgi:hypothetical protein
MWVQIRRQYSVIGIPSTSAAGSAPHATAKSLLTNSGRMRRTSAWEPNGRDPTEASNIR